MVTRTVRPKSSGSSSLHHLGVEQRGEQFLGAGHVLGLAGFGLVVLREQTVQSGARPSPGRSSTLSSIEWLTVNEEVSGSGGAPTERSNVG
jgi:hypothetical protein